MVCISVGVRNKMSLIANIAAHIARVIVVVVIIAIFCLAEWRMWKGLK